MKRRRQSRKSIPATHKSPHKSPPSSAVVGSTDLSHMHGKCIQPIARSLMRRRVVGDWDSSATAQTLKSQEMPSKASNPSRESQPLLQPARPAAATMSRTIASVTDFVFKSLKATSTRNLLGNDREARNPSRPAAHRTLTDLHIKRQPQQLRSTPTCRTSSLTALSACCRCTAL